MDTPGFRDLLRSAQAGDGDAADRLWAATRAYLRHCAPQCAGVDPPDDHSDLVQRACLQAWQKLDQFRGGDDDERTVAQYRGWLRQILQRQSMNVRRDARRQRRHPGAELISLDADDSSRRAPEPVASDLTPGRALLAAERAGAVRAAVEQIPDEVARHVVRMRFFEGQSLHQIAAGLGIGYDLVRQRFHSGMRFLERVLEFDGGALDTP